MGAVIVLGDRIAGVSAGREIGVDQRVIVVGRTRRQRTVAAAKGVGAAGPGFLAAKVGKYVAIGPAGGARHRPAVVIAWMTAAVSHRVGRRGASDNLSTCALDRAVVQALFGLAEIHPVVTPLLQDFAPTQWNV